MCWLCKSGPSLCLLFLQLLVLVSITHLLLISYSLLCHLFLVVFPSFPSFPLPLIFSSSFFFPLLLFKLLFIQLLLLLLFSSTSFLCCSHPRRLASSLLLLLPHASICIFRFLLPVSSRSFYPHTSFYITFILDK